METFVCPVSHDEHIIQEGILVPDTAANLIQIKHPHWEPDEQVS